MSLGRSWKDQLKPCQYGAGISTSSPSLSGRPTGSLPLSAKAMHSSAEETPATPYTWSLSTSAPSARVSSLATGSRTFSVPAESMYWMYRSGSRWMSLKTFSIEWWYSSTFSATDRLTALGVATC